MGGKDTGVSPDRDPEANAQLPVFNYDILYFYPNTSSGKVTLLTQLFF
jgi:hypothetical protein